jgi:hypothetical protein
MLLGYWVIGLLGYWGYWVISLLKTKDHLNNIIT